MVHARDQPGSEKTADAHPTHERAEQNAQGNRRSSDDKFQNLKPDNFINQRGAATANEQENQKRQVPLLL